MALPQPPDTYRQLSAAAAVEAPSAYSWYALAVLFLVSVFSYIDRQVFAVVLPAIQKEISVSDTGTRCIGGIAFAIFYVIAGIPIAHWADRGVRRTIIAIAIAVWSIMTALHAAAHSYLQLLLARIGVGIGEGGGVGAGQSLVSD